MTPTFAKQVQTGADRLSEAQQAARKVQTESDVIAWREAHYYPNVEIDAIHDELVAMDRAMVARVLGAGGG